MHILQPWRDRAKQASTHVEAQRISDRNFLANLRERVTQDAKHGSDIEQALAKLANEQRILPALLRCFGWREDGAFSAQWSFQVSWPNGIRGNARLYERGNSEPLLCVRHQYSDGTVKVRRFELARAYAASHGLPKPGNKLSGAALHRFRRKLYFDAGLWKVTVPKFRTPSAKQLAMLRGDVKVHLALLKGLRLQCALSDADFSKVPYSPRWAKAWNYRQLRGISLKRISRALHDLVAAGLISTNKRWRHGRRHYWITPAVQPDHGLKLEQLRDAMLSSVPLTTAAKVALLAQDGLTQAEIVRRLNLSRAVVSYHCLRRSRGLDDRSVKPAVPRPKISN